MILEPSAEANHLANLVIGAAIEVHRHLGPGYLESVYEECLGIELTERGIEFQRQHPISVRYKGHIAGESRLDLLVGKILIVELKAVDALAPIHTAQVISYLKATELRLGLLINFNTVLLRNGIDRIVLGNG